MPERQSGVGNAGIPDMEDINGSQEVSAFYSDRFYVEFGPRVRISFGEMFQGGDKKYHTAVALLPDNAVELALLILRLSGAKIETQQQETPNV